jgi:hypothetical protein
VQLEYLQSNEKDELIGWIFASNIRVGTGVFFRRRI